MNQFKSILAGVEFPECSRIALQQAARMASVKQARLHVFHVIEDLRLSEFAETLMVSDFRDVPCSVLAIKPPGFAGVVTA